MLLVQDIYFFPLGRTISPSMYLGLSRQGELPFITSELNQVFLIWSKSPFMTFPACFFTLHGREFLPFRELDILQINFFCATFERPLLSPQVSIHIPTLKSTGILHCNPHENYPNYNAPVKIYH